MLKTIFARFSAVLAALVLAFGAHGAMASVDGDWDFAVDLGGQGGGVASVTLKEEEDNKLSGQYTGQLANTPITGTLTENNGFEFSIEAQGMAITYKGTVQEDGTLKGTLDLAGMAEGTFVATKKEEQ